MKGTDVSGLDTHVMADEGGGSTPTGRSNGSGGGNGLTRVTVNLTRKSVEALEAVSDSTGYSKTDSINRALQVYAIIQGIIDENGGSLNIRPDNGGQEFRLHIV